MALPLACGLALLLGGAAGEGGDITVSAGGSISVFAGESMSVTCGGGARAAAVRAALGDGGADDEPDAQPPAPPAGGRRRAQEESPRARVRPMRPREDVAELTAEMRRRLREMEQMLEWWREECERSGSAERRRE